jgi:hypothetical protein
MDINEVGIIIQTLVTVAMFATFFVYFLQFKVMKDQLQETQKASRAQNFLSVVNYLQSEHIRKARTFVLEILRFKQFIQWSDWNDEERSEASKVCSSYDVAAIVVKQGLVPKEIIVDNWGPSIRQCYSILKPFIEDAQIRNKSTEYWNDFEWLAKECGWNGETIGNNLNQ